MSSVRAKSLRQMALERGLNVSTVSARVRAGDSVESALGVEMRNRANLVGKRFGRWVVIEEAGRDSQGAKVWLCQCDCGKRRSGPTTARLKLGASLSCGCLRGMRRATSPRHRIAEGQASLNALWTSYRIGARKRGHAWGLSREEFADLTKGDCFYCDAAPTKTIQPPNVWSPYTYNGVDRVDNAVGYRLSNCVPCCTTCNKIKGQVSRAIIERAFLKLNSQENPDGKIGP